MPMCPNCNTFVPNTPKLCPLKIGKTTGTKINKGIKKYEMKNAMLLNEIQQFVQKQPVSIPFTASDIAASLGIIWATYNDKINECLSGMVCRGIIARTHFSNPLSVSGVHGGNHRYQKLSIIKPCQWLINDSCNYFQ